MLRRLLNIASVVCLIACVALMGMWVRSYRNHEGYPVFGPGNSKVLDFSAWHGQVRILWQWKFRFGPGEWVDRTVLDCLGFEVRGNAGSINAVIPFWFLLLLAGSLAMLFRLPFPPRFTLRSLFIVTTFLAIVLGMIAWLDRAWIGK